MSEMQAREIVERGDYLVYADDGEVFGLAVDGYYHTPFMVTDLSSAEWVLGKMQEAEARLVGIEAERAELIAATNANFDRLATVHKRRSEYLDYRFGSQLQDFAAEQLRGKKVKSLATRFGVLGFRLQPSSINILDKAAAIEWARSHMPSAIETAYSVLKSKLKGHEDQLPDDAFEVTKATDKFSIKTGVK